MAYEEAIKLLTPNTSFNYTYFINNQLEEAVKAIEDKVEDLQYQIGDLQEELDNTL